MKVQNSEFVLRDSLAIPDCVHQVWLMIKPSSGLASHRNETMNLPPVL